MNLEPLKGLKGFVYLATPYSKYPAGKEQAFIDACVIAGKMIERGIGVFSPIAHSHVIAQHARIDPDSHAIWLPADQFLMDKADAIVVALMLGWSESRGVAYEIVEFEKAGKPIFYLDPTDGIVSAQDVDWSKVTR